VKRSLLYPALVTGAALSSCLLVPGARARTSTFDTDADGWTISSINSPWTGAGASYPPDWVATGGNPGGYIRESDPDGNYWFFKAPSKFLGDQSACLGGTLPWDFRVFSTSSLTLNEPMVVLQGRGHTLFAFTSVEPPKSWTNHTLTLDGTGGRVWDSVGGPMATNAQVLTVLSSVTNLRIRGEYYVGGDSEGLDNVILTHGVPEGACLPVLPLLALVPLALRRRR
jgi:hypothetical protein